jgi:hypothetical protein
MKVEGLAVLNFEIYHYTWAPRCSEWWCGEVTFFARYDASWTS